MQAATAAPPRPPARLGGPGPAPTAAQSRPASAGRRRFAVGERICPGLLACELVGGDDRVERWLAWSQALWTRVVVVLPRDEHADDLRTVRRLARESRALRRLRHPAVPRLLDDRHDQPVPHLVLEHVECRTLDQVLLSDGPLPAADVALLGVRLAAALRYAHGRGFAQLPLEARGVAVRCGQPVVLHAGAAREVRRADPEQDLVALGELLHELAPGPLQASAELRAAVEALRGRRVADDLQAIDLLAAAAPPDAGAAWPPFADPLARAV